MNWIPHLQTRNSARPAFALLSVLALLALACFPVLAQADESSGVQYETAVPTVTGHTTPRDMPAKNAGGGTPANSSSNGGAQTATGTGGSSASGSGSSSGGPSAANSNPSTASGGGADQGSEGNGSTASGGKGAGSLSGAQSADPQASSDDSSSPLIPILIAIAALAAISIGAVVIKQRRQRRSPGAHVSPKAS